MGRRKSLHADAPTPDHLAGPSPTEIKEKYPKWFGNFPYPYMNGSLHLGHAFTISKIEFGAGYQRLSGKRVLFPRGFRCTSVPIKIHTCLQPRVFSHSLYASRTCQHRPLPTRSSVKWKCLERTLKVSARKKTDRWLPLPQKAPPWARQPKGKLQAGSTYRFQIMESTGVPRSEAKKFADPHYWLEHFPPIAIVSLFRSNPLNNDPA